jgi:hypothetical protein
MLSEAPARPKAVVFKRTRLEMGAVIVILGPAALRR